MNAMLVAVGRFSLGQVLDAALSLPGAGAPDSAWGAAWCYGNRLESLKSQRPAADDPEFRRLGEARTDTLLISIQPGMAKAPLREVQPYVRREAGRQWAFFHPGRISAPERLDAGGRITDSRNPSERYFLHLLGRFDCEQPVETMTAALAGLDGEPELSCALVGCDGLVVAAWPGTELWLGTRDFVRYVAPAPIESFEEVNWERFDGPEVIATNRRRWEIQ
jgi:hypothetical protein